MSLLRRISVMALCSIGFLLLGYLGLAGAQTTITFLARDWPPELEWEYEVIAEFERLNPDIKVEVITYPAGGPARQEKLALLWATGNAPDVWGHGGPVKTFDVRGWLRDLRPFIERDRADLNVEDFFPAAWEAYQAHGRQWGLPMNSVGTFLVYNRDAFAEAGLDTPPASWEDPNWNYATMIQAAKQLTKMTNDGQVSRFGLSIGTKGYDALMWTWLHGSDWFDELAYETGIVKEIRLTDSATISAFEEIVDLMWDQRIIPGGAPWEVAPVGNAFLEGKVAMSFIPGWSLSNYIDHAGEINWGLAALPEIQTRANAIYTDPWFISSVSKHPEEAWRLIKYLVSDEVMESYVRRMSFLPARVSAADSYVSVLAEQAQMSRAEVLEVLGGAQVHGRESIDHTLYGYETVTRILDPILDEIYARNISPRQGLETAEALINAALKELQEQ